MDPMLRTCLTACLSLGAIGVAHAGTATAWPPRVTTDNGLEIAPRLLVQYDRNVFHDDAGPGGADRFADNSAFRRASIGVLVRRKGVFELVADYDLHTHNWLDDYVKFNSARRGDLRVGQMRTPVGLDDGATSSTATVFLERALPESLVHQGRRIGVDWTVPLATSATLQLGYYDGGDFDGANEGHSVAGRLAWSARRDDVNLLHLGVAASREHRDDRRARLSTKPEAGLATARLVDTGSLAQVAAIDRRGLELAWRRGPWSAQAEWLAIDVRRDGGQADVHGDGWYAQGSWMLTGETKPNAGGGFGNPVPARSGGAVELALRHSRVDLDDGAVRGGRQRDWTLGANWYVTAQLKLQANYVRVRSQRAGVPLDPRVFELRAQIAF